MSSDYIYYNNLYNSIDATVAMALFFGIISILYFKSKRATDYPSKIYFHMFLLTYFIITSNVLCDIVIDKFPTATLLINILGRMNILGVVSYLTLVTLYIYVSVNLQKFITPKQIRNSNIFTVVFVLISCAVFLPMRMDYRFAASNNLEIYGPSGPASYAAYPAIISLYYMYILAFVKYFKNITKELKQSIIYSFLTLTIGFMFTLFMSSEAALTTCLITIYTVILFFTNESTSMKLISELKEKQTEMEKVNKTQEDFLSTVSHDIRTPMNVIMGYSNSIINDKDITPFEIKNNVSNMALAVEDLYTLINRIIDISKISSGTEEIEVKDYNLIELIKKLTKEIAPSVEKARVGFRIDVNPDIPYNLNGDETKVYESILLILKNIISNKSPNIEVKFDGVINNNTMDLIIRINHINSYFTKENFNVEISNYLSEISRDNDSFKSDFLGVVIAKEFIKLINGSINYEENINTWYEIKINQKVTNMEKIRDTEIYKNGSRGDI